MPQVAIDGCIPQDIAIGANAGLPVDGNDVAKEPQVLGHHARHQPVLVLGKPVRTAGEQERSSCLVHRRDADGDQRAGTGCYGGGFDEQFNSGVA